MSGVVCSPPMHGPRFPVGKSHPEPPSAKSSRGGADQPLFLAGKGQSEKVAPVSDATSVQPRESAGGCRSRTHGGHKMHDGQKNPQQHPSRLQAEVNCRSAALQQSSSCGIYLAGNPGGQHLQSVPGGAPRQTDQRLFTRGFRVPSPVIRRGRHNSQPAGTATNYCV
jgi:hypothetical protein